MHGDVPYPYIVFGRGGLCIEDATKYPQVGSCGTRDACSFRDQYGPEVTCRRYQDATCDGDVCYSVGVL